MSAPAWIEDGTITSPAGFRAGGVYTGIKRYGPEPRLDVGLLAWDGDAAVAGMFSTNAVRGISVDRSRALLDAGGALRGLVCNSGNANTVTGPGGDADCEQMAALAAARIGVAASEMLVASTGVIGRRLPMDRIADGTARVEPTRDGGGDFARAIMTTDTRPKQAALRVAVGERVFTVGGCAKGSGMIHPNMATMFAFLATDAPADPAWLRETWREVVARTFNMLDIDMDSSTSDTALLIANGAAGGPPVDGSSDAAAPLAEAIEALARHLARELARDGEGATALIEVRAEGAASVAEARLAARTIASSPLVKTMVVGRDPNWGRVMMAAGRSGAAVDQRRASVWIGTHRVLDRGSPTDIDLALVSAAMAEPEIAIRIDLGTGGDGVAVAWGCDLTEQYVRINADYTT